jgi:uncharacterized iron-regulated protein
VALNLPRERTREVARRGFEALGVAAASVLALDATWNPARQAVMNREIADGHCGKLPLSALPRMINVQRARDAVMADALLARAAADAVLIAGNGHVRRDLGVPLHLARRAPKRSVLAVGILEVVEGVVRAEDYVAPAVGETPQFDVVVFTPRTDRPDPCAGFAPRAGAAAQQNPWYPAAV